MDPSTSIAKEKEINQFDEELKMLRVKAKIEDDDRFREKLIRWKEDLYEDLCTDAECELYRLWVAQCDDDLVLDDKYAKYAADEGCQARMDLVKNKIGTRLDKVANLVLTGEEYDDDCPAVMSIISQLYKRISDMDIQEQKDSEAIRRKLKDLYQAVIFSEEVKEEEKKQEEEKTAKAAAKIDKDRFRDRLVNWAEELYEGLCTDAECVMYEAFLDQEDCKDSEGECVRYEKYLAEEGRQTHIDATKKEIEKCLNYVINLILSDHKYDSTLSTIASALLSTIKKRLSNLENDLSNLTSDDPEPYVEWERLTQQAVKDLYKAVMYSEECRKQHKTEQAEAAAAAGAVGGDDDDEGYVIYGEMYVSIYNKGLMPYQDGPPEIPLVLEKDEETTENEATAETGGVGGNEEECKPKEKTVADDDDKEGGIWIDDGEVFTRLYNKGMLPFQEGSPEIPLKGGILVPIEEGPPVKMEEEEKTTESEATVADDNDKKGGIWIDGEVFTRLYNKGMLPFQEGPLATEAAAAARAVKDDEEKETSATKKEDSSDGGHIMDKYVCMWDDTPGLTYKQWAEKQMEEQKRAQALFSEFEMDSADYEEEEEKEIDVEKIE